MREKALGKHKWFSVDAKYFEILVEGEERNQKGCIMERSRGLVSWIHFGEEGLRNLLKGVEICCRDARPENRSFD